MPPPQPRCSHCGAPLTAPDSRFCSACGQPQQRPLAAPTAPPLLAAGGAPGAALATTFPPEPATVAATAAAALHIVEGARSGLVPLAGDAITLGRRDDNTIVLAAPFVSGRHCRFERKGAAHRVVDTGSTNGLLFNGQRVAAQDLLDGDVVRIPDPTTANFVTLTYLNPLAPRVAQAGRVARHFDIPPAAPHVTIGRAGADVVLDNPQVSRRHAQLERVAPGAGAPRKSGGGARHVLRDLRSVNGTYVNGARVGPVPVPLAPGDVIQVGPFKLRYDGARLDEYDQRGAMRIDARALRREVPASSGGRRAILDDVSLSIEPREFVALVGGSGAGKSTLMTALAGYARADAGTVEVNGDDFYAHVDAYRSALGFVPQDDIVHRGLRVDRALRYAALLRLPADTADDEIDKRVARVLEAVDMTAHRDKLVEQLSGGQRKRVSIATELLSDPSLLFLDEPTSGLDPGLEKKMMFTLRRLADSGRTVVLVTHATANITQCDHVVFLAEGKLVFFGPPAEALAFFGVAGGGDFADIYGRLEGRADPESPLIRHVLREEYAAWRATHGGAPEPPPLATLWELRWKRSPQYQRYVVGRLARAAPGPAAPAGAGAPPAASAARRAPGSPATRASRARQAVILARRYLDLLANDRRNLLLILAQAPIIGALLSLVSSGDVLTAQTAPYDAKKLLFLVSTVGVWFGVINAAREISKERSIFRRERLADLRVGAYVASKVAVLFGLVLIQSALLLGVLALRVSAPVDGAMGAASLELFVTTALAGLSGLAIGLLISALASTPDKAISAVPFALIPQILFAGLLFRLEGATGALSWLTASRWAMDALGTTVDLNSFRFGEGVVVPYDAQYDHSALHLLACWGALLGYAAVCVAAITALLKRQR